MKILCRYRDELISCSCGEEYIYGFNEEKQNNKCPNCKADTRRFCYIQIGKNIVLLEPNKYLYQIQDWCCWLLFPIFLPAALHPQANSTYSEMIYSAK